MLRLYATIKIIKELNPKFRSNIAARVLSVNSIAIETFVGLG